MVKELTGMVLTSSEQDAIFRYVQQIAENKDAALRKVGMEKIINDNSRLGMRNPDFSEAKRILSKVEKTRRIKSLNFFE